MNLVFIGFVLSVNCEFRAQAILGHAMSATAAEVERRVPTRWQVSLSGGLRDAARRRFSSDRAPACALTLSAALEQLKRHSSFFIAQDGTLGAEKRSLGFTEGAFGGSARRFDGTRRRATA